MIRMFITSYVNGNLSFFTLLLLVTLCLCAIKLLYIGSYMLLNYFSSGVRRRKKNRKNMRKMVKKKDLKRIG